MAFVIARPSSLLNLPGCKRYLVQFDLKEEEAAKVSKYARMYERAQQEIRKKPRQGIVTLDDRTNPLGHAIKAQQYALH
jgi:hypothetical protein